MNSFKCEFCGVEIQAKATHAGKLISCPSCSEELVVPDPKLEIGVECEGFIIQEFLSQTPIWTSYKAVGVKQLPGKTVLLRLPSVFVEQYAEDFHEICEIVVHNSTFQLKLIPELLGYNDISGHSWFAFEYIDNTAIIADSDLTMYAKDYKEALRIVRKIAVGLKSLSDRFDISVQNLDISNIEVGKGGSIRLFDLGLSEYALGDESLLEHGLNIWDYRYMCPEFMESGSNEGVKGDMYSLGGILFTLLTGRAPFADVEADEIVNQMTPDLHDFCPDLPHSVVDLFEALFNKYAYKRPTDWTNALALIDTALDSEDAPRNVVDGQSTAKKISTRPKSIQSAPASRKSAKARPMAAKKPTRPKSSRNRTAPNKRNTRNRYAPQKKPVNQQLLIGGGFAVIGVVIAVILLINSNNNKRMREIELKAKHEIQAAQDAANKAKKKEDAIRRQKERLAETARKQIEAQAQAAKKAVLEAQRMVDHFQAIPEQAPAQIQQPVPAANFATQPAIEQSTTQVEQAAEATPFDIPLSSLSDFQEQNPDKLDTIIERYEGLIAAIIENKNFELLKKVQPKLDVILEKREERITSAMTIIKAAIKPMIESESYSRAIQYLENYDGTDADLTQDRRDGIIELLNKKIASE